MKAYPGANGTVHYDEGLLVGYRYFDTKDVQPLFPFGYGLSYTRFSYSDLKLAQGAKLKGPLATVEFTVNNSGSRAGAEVAQVYIHQLKPSLTRPLKELKGFQRIDLKPGESRTVNLPLDHGAFAFYDPAQGGWLAEKGDYEILVGSSSRDIRLVGRFTLEQTTLDKLMLSAEAGGR